MFVEKVNRLHEQVLNEEEMKISQLPEALQRKIRGWNVLFKKLETNPEDEKLFNVINRQSIELADAIQNFVENDFEDEDEDDDGSDDGDGSDGGDGGDGKKPAENPKKDKSSSINPKKEEKDPAENPKKEEAKPKRFGNLVMEKKIMDILDSKGGRISVSELERIIGKEPDYPEQEVHNIKLRKVFMASDYRLL